MSVVYYKDQPSFLPPSVLMQNESALFMQTLETWKKCRSFQILFSLQEYCHAVFPLFGENVEAYPLASGELPLKWDHSFQ